MHKWTLIFSDQYGKSVQTFIVTGGDPQQEAIALVNENRFMSDFILIAAVSGVPSVFVRDDNAGHEYGLLGDLNG